MTKHTKDFQELESISIMTASCFSNCGALALATTHIHGRIVEVREKAVKVENARGFCWFPKRALVKRDRRHAGEVSCRVAKWFDLSRFHRWMESEPNILAG